MKGRPSFCSSAEMPDGRKKFFLLQSVLFAFAVLYQLNRLAGGRSDHFLAELRIFFAAFDGGVLGYAILCIVSACYIRTWRGVLAWAGIVLAGLLAGVLYWVLLEAMAKQAWFASDRGESVIPWMATLGILFSAGLAALLTASVAKAAIGSILQRHFSKRLKGGALFYGPFTGFLLVAYANPVPPLAVHLSGLLTIAAIVIVGRRLDRAIPDRDLPG